MLRIATLVTATLIFSHSAYAQEVIKVSRAEYAADVSNSADCTDKLGQLCDGKSRCVVKATNSLCGDPKDGIVKTLTVEFSCGKTGKQVSARENSNATLNCQ
ncbi:hypothetical protein CCZ27_17350 [Thauera sinica]|nr:hypothetical protein CCZ27_17350 [Thauera sp. K11]